MQIYHTNAVVIKTKELKNMFTQFKKICMYMFLVDMAYWKRIVGVLLKHMVNILLKHMVSILLNVL